MLLIIDGNNLAHRVKYKFSLSNRGVDVSITYGCLRSISSLISKFKPQSLMVCWDGGTPEFRRQLLPEYKANRTKGDPYEYQEFIRQVQELHEIFPLMGIVSVRKRGAEADDLMYHASKLYSGHSVIVTTDKDLYQAINPNVEVYSPTKGIIIDQSAVLEEYGVRTIGDLVHLRALMGDSSDNIRGVPGIGQKTAVKLFKEFGSLVGIVNAALGCNPLQKWFYHTKVGDSIVAVGLDKISKTVAATTLHADRVGAKAAILDAICDFQKADKDSTKRYLMRNAFESLWSSPKFLGGISKLVKPEVIDGIIKTPVVCGKRESV